MYQKQQVAKLFLLKRMMNTNFCFFVLSGKQKILFDLFKNKSVIHISRLKGILNSEFIMRYAFCFVCLFNFENFENLYKILLENKIVIYQVCVNNYFFNLNIFKVYNNSNFFFIKIFNMILIYVYLIIMIVNMFLLNLIDILYICLEQKC